METSRLEKAVSPHKISLSENETLADQLTRDLAAINDFLFYEEAEPSITIESAENHKRVAFKKIKD